MLSTAISSCSISPALIVPSPSLSSMLGIYFACLTLVKYTSGNQQLIPVESDLICISVHLDEENTDCTSFINQLASSLLLSGKKASSPNLFN